MSSVINTNISSLNAQNNLSKSQSALQTSMQRLSSGLRINSAKDDAAGSAISDRMTSQIRGMNQAARNANDGTSLAQTAEGDLNQIGTNLQRMRELAVQSANASNSAGDRAALQNEVDQLRQEIDRVAANSSFNGVKLLDGSFSSQTFQVGANNTSNDKITISSIASSRTAALGSSYSASATSASAANVALGATDITINGIAIGASLAGSDTKSSTGNVYSAIAKAAAINAVSTGVTATVNANSQAGVAASDFTAITAGDFTINGISIGAIGAAANATARGSDIATAVNAVSAATGVSAASVAGVVTLTAADGRNITTGTTGTANLARTGFTFAAATTTASTITLTSTTSNGFVLADGGSTTGAANLGITMGTKAATQTGTALSAIDISSVAGAQTAMDSIDSALSSVNNSRASLGAYQNRFASVVSSLQTTSENLTASRSRIQDADFAAETSSMTRGQILQQAGTAMLAQANSLPNGVMALLRG